MGRGWIGVDLDGTLAIYDGWKGAEHIGEPILAMRARVLEWLATGKDVRIFTARVSEPRFFAWMSVHAAIELWCVQHLGRRLPITNVKDFGMVELWDDRAVQVIPNAGIPVDVRRRMGAD